MRASRNHAVVVDLVGVGSDARVVVRNNTSGGRLLFAGVLRKTASLRLEGRRFWVRLGEPRAVRLRVDGRRAFLSRRARIFVVTEDGVRVLPPPTPDVPQPAPPAASVSDTAVPIADSTQMPTESPSPPPSSPPSSSGPPASSGSSSDGGTPSPDPPGVDPTPDPEPR